MYTIMLQQVTSENIIQTFNLLPQNLQFEAFNYLQYLLYKTEHNHIKKENKKVNKNPVKLLLKDFGKFSNVDFSDIPEEDIYLQGDKY